MWKLNLFFAFLFLGVLGTDLQAQSIPQNPNLTDKDGKRQGKWTILYDNNQKVITDTAKTASYRLITYQNDKPIGKVTDHYRNGIVEREMILLADRPQEVMEGLVVYYDEQGQLESEKSFLDHNSWKALDKASSEAYKAANYKKIRLGRHSKWRGRVWFATGIPTSWCKNHSHVFVESVGRGHTAVNERVLQKLTRR